MDSKIEEALKLQTAAGLEKCLRKLTLVSPGDWRLTGVRVFSGQVREAVRRKDRKTPPGAVIRVKIKGEPPFITALLFDPADTGHISGCFAEGAFYGPLSKDQPEVTIIEIGNIVLNAMANSLLKALRKTAIPSVPAYFKGDPGAMEAWLGAGPDVFTTISVAFTVGREGRSADIELLAFLPPSLAAQALPG